MRKESQNERCIVEILFSKGTCRQIIRKYKYPTKNYFPKINIIFNIMLEKGGKIIHLHDKSEI